MKTRILVPCLCRLLGPFSLLVPTAKSYPWYTKMSTTDWLLLSLWIIICLHKCQIFALFSFYGHKTILYTIWMFCQSGSSTCFWKLYSKVPLQDGIINSFPCSWVRYVYIVKDTHYIQVIYLIGEMINMIVIIFDTKFL